MGVDVMTARAKRIYVENQSKQVVFLFLVAVFLGVFSALQIGQDSSVYILDVILA